MNPSEPRADTGFSYSRAFFETLVDHAIEHAKKIGATDAAAEASEGCGLSVGVRKGELETVERNRDKSLGITVYVGQRRGNASTSDFSGAAIEQTVQAAYDIARFTAADPMAGLPDADDIAPPESHRTDLELFYPWSITSEGAADIALQCEAAAFATSKRIVNSEGAGVSAQQSHFFTAHTRGFRGGDASSRHSLSVAPIAQSPGRKGDMQRDAWYSSMRDAQELAAPADVGRYAAERALSRLGSRKIATIQCPVLFVLASTDQLFPPGPEVEALLPRFGGPVTYRVLETPYGHLASGVEWRKWEDDFRALLLAAGHGSLSTKATV